MKLKHLLQSIQTDIVDAQRQSYRHSQKIAKNQKNGLLPVPFVSDVDVQLTLNFALENKNESPGYSVEYGSLSEVLKPKMVVWMREVLNELQISEEVLESNNAVPEFVEEAYPLLEMKWEELLTPDFRIKENDFVELLTPLFQAFFQRKLKGKIVMTKEMNPLKSMETCFQRIMKPKIEVLETLVQQYVHPKQNLMMDVIVDAKQLEKLPEKAIHTATVNVKLDELNTNNYVE